MAPLDLSFAPLKTTNTSPLRRLTGEGESITQHQTVMIEFHQRRQSRSFLCKSPPARPPEPAAIPGGAWIPYWAMRPVYHPGATKERSVSTIFTKLPLFTSVVVAYRPTDRTSAAGTY